ncbi:MAG: hypothetical protein AAF823_13605 [Planctomycetota bacterium]
MQNTLSLEATYLRLCVAMGLNTPLDVVRWADAWIRRLDAPTEQLIHIASQTDASHHEIMDALSTLTSEEVATEAAHRALGKLTAEWKRKTISIDHVVRAARAYSCFAQAEENERLNASSLEDCLADANAGVYGTLDSVTEEIDCFFNKYALPPLTITGDTP